VTGLTNGTLYSFQVRALDASLPPGSVKTMAQRMEMPLWPARTAAGFLGVHSLPDLASLLGLPSDHLPIGVVTVGVPAPDRRSSSLDRGRKRRDSVVHWETWGR